MEWVKTHPCWHCERPGRSDPHHLRNPGHTRRFQDVENIVPLCRSCHTIIQTNPEYERSLHDRMKAEAVRLYGVFLLSKKQNLG